MVKDISGTVGPGEANHPADVMIVQYLLNCVPASEGGPREELVIDGRLGPVTIGAVRRLQHAHFGWEDGRVHPGATGGQTMVRLCAFDPLPDAPPVTPPLPNFPGYPKRGPARKKSPGRQRVPAAGRKKRSPRAPTATRTAAGTARGKNRARQNRDKRRR
jgi:hypothetical protein